MRERERKREENVKKINDKSFKNQFALYSIEEKEIVIAESLSLRKCLFFSVREIAFFIFGRFTVRFNASLIVGVNCAISFN